MNHSIIPTDLEIQNSPVVRNNESCHTVTFEELSSVPSTHEFTELHQIQHKTQMSVE